MSVPTENAAGVTAIRPFTIPVTPEAEIEALLRSDGTWRRPTTSPPGKSRTSSRPRFGPRSGHCAKGRSS